MSVLITRRHAARAAVRTVWLGCLLAAAAIAGCGEDGGYLDQLRNGSADQRAHAAAFLGAQQEAEAAPYLVAALRDSVPAVRAKAAWALGMLGAKEALNPLVACLRDSSSRVRQQAALALMALEEPEAIGPLEAAFRVEPDPWVQGDLRKAVGHLRQFQGEADLSEGTFR